MASLSPKLIMNHLHHLHLLFSNRAPPGFTRCTELPSPHFCWALLQSPQPGAAPPALVARAAARSSAPAVQRGAGPRPPGAVWGTKDRTRKTRGKSLKYPVEKLL